MTIVTLFIAFGLLANKEDWCVGLLMLIFLLPAAALATPIYMGFVLIAAFAKLYNPLMKDEDEVLGGCMKGDNVKLLPAMLRMVEVVGESYPQALLGELPLTWSIKHHHIQFFVIIIIILIIILFLAQDIGSWLLVIIIIIITTRPRPAFGRLGLGRSSRGKTLGVSLRLASRLRRSARL